MTKIELRQKMLSERARMSKSEVCERSFAIVQSVRLDHRYQSASKVALFYPMKNEINLLDLLHDPKTFLFPRVEKDGIHFYRYEKNTPFIRSSFGVMEPIGTMNEDQDIDYMLVPALAISDEGYRIGYGKAYYDRFLSTNRPKTVIGVIYAFQHVSSFQHDQHDQRVDDIIEG